MASTISDKSRRFCLLALDELEKIQQTYPTLPKISALNEAEVAWLNERMRSFHESVARTNYKRFSFFDASRSVRNYIAHITADFSPEELQKKWQTFFELIDTAKAELQQSVEKSNAERKEIRQFEKFGSSQMGDSIERKRLTQSLSDAMDASLSEREKLPFRESVAAQEAKQFFTTETKAQKDLLDFAATHTELSQQIQAEILDCLQTAYDETAITNPQNPFYDENIVVNSTQRAADNALLKTLADVKETLYATQTGKDNTADFDFYAKQYAELTKPVKKPRQKKVDTYAVIALSRNCKKDMQTSLQERYLAWQLEEIDKRRKAYLAELYEKIEKFKKIEALLFSFTKQFRRLWDLSTGSFDDCGFEILQQFADLLKNDSSLQELSEMIGRQATEKDRYEKELRDKLELKTEFYPQSAYRGQITGLRLSGEISSALYSELATLQNDATKLYFYQKVADKKLLSYAYENQQRRYKEVHTTEQIETVVKEKETKGPVIICVDTSDSMSGPPEQVAKTISFALAKKCLEEDRKCYLISFSTNIEVQDLSEFKGANGLAALVAFLRKSFNGGTNATKALVHSLTLLKQQSWKNADVLMVTDGEMDNFSESLVADIHAQQKEKTKFYLLEVGNSGNKNVISVFNEYWQYDTTARDAMRHLVRHLQTVT